MTSGEHIITKTCVIGLISNHFTNLLLFHFNEQTPTTIVVSWCVKVNHLDSYSSSYKFDQNFSKAHCSFAQANYDNFVCGILWSARRTTPNLDQVIITSNQSKCLLEIHRCFEPTWGKPYGCICIKTI